MTWGITDRWLGMCGGWRCWLPAEWGATFATELGSWQHVRPALGAAGLQRGATLDAELDPLGSVSVAAWAAHQGALRHGCASGGGRLGKSPGARPRSPWVGWCVSTPEPARCQA